MKKIRTGLISSKTGHKEQRRTNTRLCFFYCLYDRYMRSERGEIIKNLAEQLPKMSERERGYLEGTIATAAAMSKKDKEGEKNECVDPH